MSGRSAERRAVLRGIAVVVALWLVGSIVAPDDPHELHGNVDVAVTQLEP